VIVGALSAVYGAAATWRRRWYAGARSRRLRQPVVSIGNLRVGGTGKTPVTAYVARVLADHGEHPVILSRGYARERASAGVTVVSNRERVIADVAHAGDEPLLLARALPGVPVLVCADRYQAGCHGEAEFGATVHILDDGFQHVQLARDIDLLLVDEHDLDDRVLPAGRLREPLANAAIADAVLVPMATVDRAAQLADRLHIERGFSVTRRLTAVRPLATESANGGSGTPRPAVLPAPAAPWLAFAGIARPERFFSDLRAAGYNLRETIVFPDHHAFRAADLARLGARARAVDAAGLITTEKDSMRLAPDAVSALPIAVAPLAVAVEPAADFAGWLVTRLAESRAVAVEQR
jgi:tetraacyldisaccharide 4'-kinase